MDMQGWRDILMWKTYRKVDQSRRLSSGDGKIMKAAVFGRLCCSGMYHATVFFKVAHAWLGVWFFFLNFFSSCMEAGTEEVGKIAYIDLHCWNCIPEIMIAIHRKLLLGRWWSPGLTAASVPPEVSLVLGCVSNGSQQTRHHDWWRVM